MSEVFGEDQPGREREGEALDFLGHVRRGQPLQVAQEHVESSVKLILERGQLSAGERPAPTPPAVRALEPDLPMLLTRFLPVVWLHQFRVAAPANVQV
jgi:hypothetical protein